MVTRNTSRNDTYYQAQPTAYWVSWECLKRLFARGKMSSKPRYLWQKLLLPSYFPMQSNRMGCCWWDATECCHFSLSPKSQMKSTTKEEKKKKSGQEISSHIEPVSQKKRLCSHTSWQLLLVILVCGTKKLGTLTLAQTGHTHLPLSLSRAQHTCLSPGNVDSKPSCTHVQ